MGNHCLETVCRVCSAKYCLRCEFGICSQCGTLWTAESVKTTDMDTIDEIMEKVALLSKQEKNELVNRIIASMSGADPVYAALRLFGGLHKELKGTPYGGVKFMPADYRGMKLLLKAVGGKIEQCAGREATKDELLDNLEAFIRQVAVMKNNWYFNNRFTPANLAADFEKIYSNIVNNSGYARRKTVYDSFVGCQGVHSL